MVMVDGVRSANRPLTEEDVCVGWIINLDAIVGVLTIKHELTLTLGLWIVKCGNFDRTCNSFHFGTSVLPANIISFSLKSSHHTVDEQDAAFQ